MIYTSAMEPYVIPKHITSEDIKRSQPPVQLPKSWTQAAGLMRHKKGALRRHITKIRREWDSRDLQK